MAFVLAAWMAVFLLEKDHMKKAFVLIAALVLAVVSGGDYMLLSAVLVGGALVSCVRNASFHSRVVKAAFLFGMLLLFVMNGALLRDYQFIRPSQTPYGMTREEQEALDLLLAEGASSFVIVPEQLAPYVGIYSSAIESFCEYTSGGETEQTGARARVSQEMSSHHPDMRVIASAARQEGCAYIILDTGYHYPETLPESCDFDPVGTAGDYVVYKDMQ